MHCPPDACCGLESVGQYIYLTSLLRPLAVGFMQLASQERGACMHLVRWFCWLLSAFILFLKIWSIYYFQLMFFWIKRDSKLELYFGFGCCWEVGIGNLFHLPSVYSISLPIIIIFSWVSIAKINRRMNKCTTRTATNSTKPIILRVATNVTRLVDIYSCCNQFQNLALIRDVAFSGSKCHAIPSCPHACPPKEKFSTKST